MGAWLGRRTEPRVDFREAVRVIWPGEVSGVVARAVNLSSTGILVDAPTPTPCPVGSDVLCDVTLPRGPRLLRGRVAHRRLLSSAKVGMGIEFIDLSPREVAELRDVVDVSDEKPQRVKVRFEGTTQVVRARAFATDSGFQLATSLPFLKADTAVDISLGTDAGVAARGWVSAVALDRSGTDGIPRLLIDVRVDAPDPWEDPSSALTPVVEPIIEELIQAHGAASLDAVPEQIWEPDELGATTEFAAVDSFVETDENVPTVVTAGPGATPAFEDLDRTMLLPLASRGGRWRVLGSGMVAGAVALAAVAGAVVIMRASSRPSAPPSIDPPVSVTQAVAPTASAPAPSALAPSIPAIAAAVGAPAPADFTIGLTGSLAGARRYPLSKPDGVAFNLPRALATMKVGTYRPDVPGLRSVWVRDLPGGGAHLRFYFTAARPAPRVALERGAVRVTTQ